MKPQINTDERRFIAEHPRLSAVNILWKFMNYAIITPICEGRPVRSKALASGANPEGVRGFKSHPSHFNPWLYIESPSLPHCKFV